MKKSKGKTLSIIVLSIIILSLCGYITYDKFTKNNNDENTKKYKQEIKRLNNQLNNLKKASEDCTTYTTNAFDNIVGNYSYEETFKIDDTNNCTATINLTLKADGTYHYENYSTCGGGTEAFGTYALNKNKLYLHNDNCQPITDYANNQVECTYGNCHPIIEIEYKDGKLFDSAVGGRVAEVKLKKN